MFKGRKQTNPDSPQMAWPFSLETLSTRITVIVINKLIGLGKQCVYTERYTVRTV